MNFKYILLIFSKFFRILAFSVDAINHVSVKIDKENKWRNCSNVQGSPVYITEWDFNKYSSGLHTINVSKFIIYIKLQYNFTNLRLSLSMWTTSYRKKHAF